MTLLKPKVERFVLEYHACGCGAKAARAAGYACKNVRKAAYMLLKRPAVQERLRELREVETKAKIMSHDQLCEAMSEIVEKGMVNSERVAAGNLLGKLRGYFPPERHEGEVKVVKEVVFVRPKNRPAAVRADRGGGYEVVLDAGAEPQADPAAGGLDQEREDLGDSSVVDP